RHRIDAHSSRHLGISFFPRLYSRRRMEVQRSFQTLRSNLLQKSIGIGKEQLVPGVSRPAKSVSGLVVLAAEPVLVKREMPVHVDDQHIERDIVVAEAANQVFEFLITVSPIA